MKTLTRQQLAEIEKNGGRVRQKARPIPEPEPNPAEPREMEVLADIAATLQSSQEANHAMMIAIVKALKADSGQAPVTSFRMVRKAIGNIPQVEYYVELNRG